MLILIRKCGILKSTFDKIALIFMPVNKYYNMKKLKQNQLFCELISFHFICLRLLKHEKLAKKRKKFVTFAIHDL